MIKKILMMWKDSMTEIANEEYVKQLTEAIILIDKG